MNALDHPHTTRATPTWTAELVKQRMVEAFATERRIPDRGARRIKSTWPATPLHEFQEMIHWTDARQRVWDSWANTKTTSPLEVSRMEEAMNWLRWLPDGERNCLQAWSAAKANRIPVRKVLRKHGGWTVRTFYRQTDKGAARIAIRLNTHGVTVR